MLWGIFHQRRKVSYNWKTLKDNVLSYNLVVTVTFKLYIKHSSKNDHAP